MRLIVRLVGTIAAYIAGVLTISSIVALWYQNTFPLPVLLSRIPPGEQVYAWLVERTWVAAVILGAELLVLVFLFVGDALGLRARRPRVSNLKY